EILLHSPVKGNEVLLSVIWNDADPGALTTTTAAWLQHDLGFSKCMEAASKIACLLRAFALSCWKDEVGAVFPPMVFP
ncbi:hypothetical protein HDU93_006607, partial [Gonapodya sp. JEL0774]